MHLRRLIGIFAIMGVLLHAGVLVRHNALMLNATLQYQDLVADLTAMCHGAGTTSDSELPYIPRPSGADFGCPICSGIVAAVAVVDSAQVVIAWPHPHTWAPSPYFESLAGIDRWSLPPARGPPSALA
jgi:hypothetical protein